MAFDPRDPYRNQAGAPTSTVGHQPGYSGNNNAAEYTASGVPFSEQFTVTSSSVVSTSFPFITSELYIKNDGSADIAFGWTENGVLLTNRHTLKSAESVTLRIRTTRLYVTAVAAGTGSVNVTAALTVIPAKSFPLLTGSLANAVTGLPVYITGALEMRWGYNGVG